MSKVDLIKNPLVQSGYTYLQAVGSNSVDFTTSGRHLRWDFLRTLGENHLAKGDYISQSDYSTKIGFNKSKDYVKIYRTGFSVPKYYITLDFSVKPTDIIKTPTSRGWLYSIPVNGLPEIKDDVIVRFMDINQYDSIYSSNPSITPIQFLSLYTGIVEVEPQNKLSFWWMFNVEFARRGGGNSTNGYLRVESVCVPDTVEFSAKQVSCRKKFTAQNTNRNKSANIICENIQYLRFDYAASIINGIAIITYSDFIEGVNYESEKGSWDLIGDFALTLDDDIMKTRFAETRVDTPNLHWPKFNESNQSTGEFAVNKTNYYNRWRKPGAVFNPSSPTGNDLNGLQYAVHTYMKNSTTDTRAITSFASDDPSDSEVQTWSVLDMLRLNSLDFHNARILGLGYLDVKREEKPEDLFIYCLEYKTFAPLEAPLNSELERTHIFMSLPTSMKDYRLPASPNLTPLTYGVTVDNGTGQPTSLTDAQGYVPLGEMRFININRGAFNYEKPFGPFYVEPTEYCLCDETQAIGFGVEYKEISEANYRKPELSSDPDYFDATGLRETMMILENGKPTLYTHQEIEEGTHMYGAYSINWFSRVSPLSNTLQTTTQFPKQYRLLPPFNYAVQLIQDEDPGVTPSTEKSLILTTVAEQDALATITTTDNTLVRTTFDWNYIHHHAHQNADYAEFLFRKAEPKVVKGKITGITQLSGNRVQVTTGSYIITSTGTNETIQPSIAPSESQKFVGSYFSSGSNNFEIESVNSSGSNPTFILKKIKQIQAVPTSVSTPGQFISNETYVSPSVNDLFFTVENLSVSSNWDLRHTKRVYLEKFYTNSKVGIRYSPTRIVYHDINSVNPLGSNTEVVVEKPILLTNPTTETLEYTLKNSLNISTPNTIVVSGDQSADFAPGKSFRVIGSSINDGIYVVSGSIFSGPKTIVTITTTFDDSIAQNGFVEITVNRPILSVNQSNNSFVIAGNKIGEIGAASIEYRTEDDGSLTRFVVSGINDTVSFSPIFETVPVTVPPSAHIPAATGFIRLNFGTASLDSHPDENILWYKGVVRLTDVTNKKQAYPVVFIENQSPLTLVIQDPGFIPKDPSVSGSADIFTIDFTKTNANFHPSYKLYLTQSDGLDPVTGNMILPTGINFDSQEILPDNANPNEGNRYTYMAVRSYDAKLDIASYISSPVVLLAQKITVPVAPGPPSGPLYATRPDFYGKSTYTFDTELQQTGAYAGGGRIPYSIVFYRSSEDRILDVLYKKSTQDSIWAQLNALTDPKAKFDPQLWAILFSGSNNGANFTTYTTTAGTFTWPLPDNDQYVFPFEVSAHLPNAVYRPFSSGNSFMLNNPKADIYGKLYSPLEILRKAILSVFLPLTEQPPMYAHLKQGTQTSNIKVKPRDAYGNLIDPVTSGIDLYPMIKLLPLSSTDPAVNRKVRFTDYTLDGSAKNVYFYLAMEMSDKFKFSEPSLPVGPVMLVNALPAEKPQIRKVISVLQNAINNEVTSVLFDINEYSANEKISKIEIYRAYNELDAKSTRTMTKAKTIAWGDPIVDDFSDLTFPAYGEDLHYRVIAIREVEDVIDVVLNPALTGGPVPVQLNDIPSLPSEVAKTLVVDTINPQAPKLYSINGFSTLTDLQNVLLKWDSTCYNGTYYLQKLNASGNWVEIYKTKQTSGTLYYPPLDGLNNPDFTNFPETAFLERMDENGNPMYHRFRVQVENSSGLFNLSEYEITLAKGASDLQEMPSQLSFADGNLHTLSVLNNFDIITGASQPNSLTFTHLDNPLPAGHNSFSSMDITVSDDLGNNKTLSITVPESSVIFDSVTAPTLDLMSANRKYTIKTKLFTDFATNGAVQIFTINYLAGPSYDLKQVTSLVKLTDSNHDVNPLISGNINNGVAYPTQLQFTKIVDLSSINQTFNHMDIVVTDDLGNTATKTIATAGTDVTFTSADGLVLDNTNPNRSYEIKAKIYTDEAPAGNEIVYNISYTYTPCDDITTLTGIAKFTDNNGTTINPIANQTITSVTHPNGSITLQDLVSANLPSGHTFNHMDIILEDDLGGAFIKTINTASGNVTFNNGDGGLVLNNSNPHRTYFVTAVLYTNLCSNGASYTYTIKY